MPIGRKPVVIEFPIQRVECKFRAAIRQVKVGIADENSRYTRAFERYVLDLSGHTTITDTAGPLGVSWDVVKGIQKRYLQRKSARPKQIAIDEIYVGKRHKYFTIALDSGRVHW